MRSSETSSFRSTSEPLVKVRSRPYPFPPIPWPTPLPPSKKRHATSLGRTIDQQVFDSIKNVTDRVFALAIICMLSPLFAATALLIALDSPGALFYSQWRRGRDQQLFRIYKFRTMENGAHRKRSRLFHRSEVDGIIFKIKSDPRITRVGQWLRKTSIDELPQLWNVVRGDMSLVGPRPFSQEVFNRPYEHALYATWLIERHRVRPGITGLWQVSGRNNLPFEKLMKLDLSYVRRRCWFLDLSILARTFSVVIRQHGAY